MGPGTTYTLIPSTVGKDAMALTLTVTLFVYINLQRLGNQIKYVYPPNRQDYAKHNKDRHPSRHIILLGHFYDFSNANFLTVFQLSFD